MSNDERKMYHVRLSALTVEILGHAQQIYPYMNIQELLDEGMKALNIILMDKYDNSKDEARVEYEGKVKGIERLKVMGDNMRLGVPEPPDRDTVHAMTAVADARSQPPVECLYVGEDLQQKRAELLNKCRETTAAGAVDWSKGWKTELAEVGWGQSHFVTAFMEFLKQSSAQIAGHAAPVHDSGAITPVQYRIEALVTRLHRIAMGAKEYANFKKDFEDIQMLIRNGTIDNNGQLEQFKRTVIQKFENKVRPDIISKKARQENKDVTLAIFEDRWFQEFEAQQDELSESENRLIGG